MTEFDVVVRVTIPTTDCVAGQAQAEQAVQAAQDLAEVMGARLKRRVVPAVLV